MVMPSWIDRLPTGPRCTRCEGGGHRLNDVGCGRRPHLCRHLALTWPRFAYRSLDKGDPLQVQQFGVRFEVAHDNARGLLA